METATDVFLVCIYPAFELGDSGVGFLCNRKLRSYYIKKLREDAQARETVECCKLSGRC